MTVCSQKNPLFYVRVSLQENHFGQKTSIFIVQKCILYDKNRAVVKIIKNVFEFIPNQLQCCEKVTIIYQEAYCYTTNLKYLGDVIELFSSVLFYNRYPA